jgi:hypothetical protein
LQQISSDSLHLLMLCIGQAIRHTARSLIASMANEPWPAQPWSVGFSSSARRASSPSSTMHTSAKWQSLGSLPDNGTGQQLHMEVVGRVRCESCGATLDTPAQTSRFQVAIAGHDELACNSNCKAAVLPGQARSDGPIHIHNLRGRQLPHCGGNIHTPTRNICTAAGQIHVMTATAKHFFTVLSNLTIFYTCSAQAVHKTTKCAAWYSTLVRHKVATTSHMSGARAHGWQMTPPSQMMYCATYTLAITAPGTCAEEGELWPRPLA